MRSAFVFLSCLFLSLTAAAQDTGEISVSIPEGQTARIFLNGEDTGQNTPATLRGIPQGRHQVQVRGECTVASQEVFLTPGASETLNLTPQSMGGFVEIAVQPASAKIFLDGRPIGTGPSIGLEVDCGNHVFEFRALHYAAEEHPISIGMGNVIQLSVDLQQAGTGNIAVIVDPESADLFLDGRKVATGNTTLSDIGQGSHLLGAMLEGYEPIERRIEVKAGETAEVELRLKAEVDDIYTANQPETASPTESAPESTTASGLSNTDNTNNPDSNGTNAPQAGTDLSGNATPEDSISTATALYDPTSSRTGRHIAGGSVLGVSLLSGFLAWRSWHDVTMVRYANYVEHMPTDEYYQSKVRPAQLFSVGLGIASGASLLGGASLLFYDEGGGGFHWNRRF
jgi:hypothetical protein